MKLDDQGRRVDGRHLTYSEYVNVPALLESLRLPADVPKGIVAARWPQAPPDWKPGDPWPRGGNWSHDEALFITVHQAFEVWFRQILHELHDLTTVARETAAAHGASIPFTHLARRQVERAPKVARLRSRLPRFSALAARSNLADLLFQELPAPGVLPEEAEGEPEARAALQWFEPHFARFTERVERATAMLHVCVPFFDVLARMTPASFLEFRDRLFPASGFGSTQFRLLEIGLGLRERHFAKFDPRGAAAAALQQRFGADQLAVLGPFRPEDAFGLHSPADESTLLEAMLQPGLRDLVLWLLRAREFTGAAGEARFGLADRLAARNLAQLERERSIEDKSVSAVVSHDVYRHVAAVLAHFETVAAASVLETQDSRSGFGRFLEACLRLDEHLLGWRQRHIRFVERMIGARPGTGGGGLAYLRRSISVEHAPWYLRAFPSLWDARTVLLRDEGAS